MQSDDRPPSGPDPTVAAIRELTLANLRAGKSPAEISTFNSIAGAYQRSPLIAAADRTIVLNNAISQIEKNPTDSAAQLALAYSYIQALDTYQSAVREGELQNLGLLAARTSSGSSRLARGRQASAICGASSRAG
jgi:hypothetical protein